MSEVIENILVLLEEGETYSIENISLKTNIQKNLIEEIIDFLRLFSFVEFDEKREEVKLSHTFLEFLYKVK